MRNPHAGIPFTAADMSDDAIAKALEDVSIPTLLLSCVHMSGDAGILDRLIGRLAPGGEIVLAGFYDRPLSFAFPPAFMREAQIRVAAEWKPADMKAVCHLAETGALSLDGLITHHAEDSEAERADRTAFGDNRCLKMVLDWRATA